MYYLTPRNHHVPYILLVLILLSMTVGPVVLQILDQEPLWALIVTFTLVWVFFLIGRIKKEG